LVQFELVFILSVDLSVGQLVVTMYFGKMAVGIEMPFAVVGWVGPRNDVLDRHQILQGKGQIFMGNAVAQNVIYREYVASGVSLQLVLSVLWANLLLISL